jgi:NADPH-dependent ferric siderophore reductase
VGDEVAFRGPEGNLVLRPTDYHVFLGEGRPAENSAGLLAAARELDLPVTPGFLYLAGEAKTCAAIRRHFIDDRGWPAKTSMTVKPFWTPGKRGLE